MYIEKRQYQRLTANDGDVLHSKYKCLDFSESGMKFHSITEVTQGRIISVKLMVLTDPIKLKCEVMWCREAASVHKEGYHFGVQFLDLGWINLLELRKFIIAQIE